MLTGRAFVLGLGAVLLLLTIDQSTIIIVCEVKHFYPTCGFNVSCYTLEKQ